MIEVKGLKKKFGDKPALRGIDFLIDSEIIFALVGPDGAGKTTLMRILAGIMAPDAGEINILGNDIVKKPESAKKQIGYLSQRFSLSRTLTVEENIEFFGDLYSVPESEKQARKSKLLDFSRLDRFKNRLAGQLSGGMKQKLALCCSLIHTPRILLLDEPTTGVDPISRRELWEILYDLLADGVIILLSTPYMDEAERAGEIMLLHKGEVLSKGRFENLKSGYKYSLYEAVCDDNRRASEILSARMGKNRVVFFGDKLHLALDRAEESKAVSEILSGAGIAVISMQSISPELEDIFIQELTDEKVVGR